MYFIPADKGLKPIMFDQLPTAKGLLSFIYKRASVRFNYNEIYGKVVNYKFEKKEKDLAEAQKRKDEADEALLEEDEL